MTKFIILLINILLILASCNCIKDKPKDKNTIDANNFAKSCKLNINNLKNFIGQDVTKDIDCLKSQLDSYRVAVKQDDFNALNKNQLDIFLTNYVFKDTSFDPSLLDLLFSLNVILFGGSDNYINYENLDKFFTVLKIVNIEASKVFEIFKNHSQITKDNLPQFRSAMNDSIDKIASSISSLTFNKRLRTGIINFNIFYNVLNNNGFSAYTEKIKDYMFLKVLFTGGDENTLSTIEFDELINKLKDLIGSLFDVLTLKKENYANNNEYFSFIEEILATFSKTIHPPANDNPLLSIKKMTEIISTILPSLLIDDLDKLLENVKFKIFGGDKESISINDLSIFLSIAREIIAQTIFNYKEYKNYYGDGFPHKDNLVELKYFSFLSDAFKDDFYRIIKKYHLFTLDDTAPLYALEAKVTLRGIDEITVAEKLFKYVFKGYGIEIDGKYYLNLDSMIKLTLDFKPILEANHLWRDDYVGMATNTFMMADLFQFQANGNGLVDLEEASEYFILSMTATRISKKVYSDLVEACALDSNGKIPYNCFIEEFYKSFLNYETFFPKLIDFFKTASHEVYIDYITAIENFARLEKDKGHALDQRDLILMIGGILFVENVMIRFDENNNNIFDYEEILKAYPIYENAVAYIAKIDKNDPKMMKYVKSIYLYLLKYRKIPKKGLNFLIWHNLSSHKVTADRRTIATILAFITAATETEQ